MIIDISQLFTFFLLASSATKTRTSSETTIFEDTNDTESLILSGIISTIAAVRSGGYLEDVVRDAEGNLFISSEKNMILKVTASTGNITIVAGTASWDGGFSGDGGLATSATIHYPQGIALDKFGNIFFADYLNHRIRKITVSTGIITTVAGNGGSDYEVDNVLATSTAVIYPMDVAFDTYGNIYIAQRLRVRKVTASTGIITSIAGNGQEYGQPPKLGVSATVNNSLHPDRIAVDTAGNVFFTGYSFNSIYKITASTGILTLIAGNNNWYYGYNGDDIPATTALLSYPSYITVDALGNIFFTDTWNYRIRKITASTGIITTVAGITSLGYGLNNDGKDATSAELGYLHGVTLDTAGSIYFCELEYLRKITYSELAPSAAVTRAPTLTPASSGTGSPTAATPVLAPMPSSAASASSGIISTVVGRRGDIPTPPLPASQFVGTRGLAIDTAGNFFISTEYNMIVKVTASTGIVTTVAGTGVGNFSGDGGLATSATIHYPEGIALDKVGNIFFADYLNHRIRKITVSTGIITTVAGNGGSDYEVDNVLATSTAVIYPKDVAFDTYGNIYIAQSRRVRKVTASTGIITTFTGNGRRSGIYRTSAELGVSASVCNLADPRGVTVDASGNVFITDRSFESIYKVAASTGLITLVAGTNRAGSGFNGDDIPATTALLSNPRYITVDALGNIFFSDSENRRVRKITASTGIITTVAGKSSTKNICNLSRWYEYDGDGKISATSVVLCGPDGVAVDTAGSIYFCDSNALRKVTYSEVAPSEAVTRAPTLTPASSSTGSPTAATPVLAPAFTPASTTRPSALTTTAPAVTSVSSGTESPTAATPVLAPAFTPASTTRPSALTSTSPVTSSSTRPCIRHGAGAHHMAIILLGSLLILILHRDE
jgi:trimeric autotransporter adhesin